VKKIAHGEVNVEICSSNSSARLTRLIFSVNSLNAVPTAAYNISHIKNHTLYEKNLLGIKHNFSAD
jgi:hypothetical protein